MFGWFFNFVIFTRNVMASWFVKLPPSSENGNPMGNRGSTSPNDEGGGPSSSASDPDLERTFKKINDSVYELYAPKAGEPEIEIIFFHGLQPVGDYKEAYWKTWSSDNGKTVWPQTLLGSTFKKARIWSVSYDSSARKTSTEGNMDIFNIAENFISDIIDSEPNRGDRPVILVGHSLGCLVIKNFVVAAPDKARKYNAAIHKDKIDKINSFLNNLCGVFFYSPPNDGSRLADLADKVPVKGKSEVLLLLKALNKQVARLNERFRKFRANRKIPIFTCGEAQATTLWGLGSIVVPEASALKDTDDFVIINADHINVCKPQNESDNSFLKLKQFVQDCVQKRNPNLLQDDQLT